MRFTWDEAKRRANLAKHGLDFADAQRVLEGPVVEFVDSRFHYGEQRIVSLGWLDTLVVVIISADRDNTIRIISMRKATKHETDIYFETQGRP